MTKRRKMLIVGGSVLAICAAGGGVALATGAGDDSEAPIPDGSLEQASAAALESTGGGTVSETEVGDEESYYEVEVTRDDGSQIDVQLDKQFNVVGSEGDGSGEDESGSDEGESEGAE
jgi:hypothetical protein